jgi:hypothetical protein
MPPLRVMSRCIVSKSIGTCVYFDDTDPRRDADRIRPSRQDGCPSSDFDERSV